MQCPQTPQQTASLPNAKLSFRAEQADDFSSLSLRREVGLRSREISLRSLRFSEKSSLCASLLARRQQKRDEILQILFGKTLGIARRHQGLARLLERTQLGLLKRMQLFPGVQHLNRKTVFVEHHALQLCPLGSYHCCGLIFLRKILHRLGQSCRQSLARTAHRLPKIINGPGCPRGREIRPHAPALAIHHLAGSPGRTPVEKVCPLPV